ncbi:MAG: DUF4956 domain-containing protein [Vicinamibacterales bacterium]
MAESSPLARVVHVVTRPPRSPLTQLTLYFAGLTLAGWALITFVPLAEQVIRGVAPQLASAGGELQDLLGEPSGTPHRPPYFDLRMMLVMAGTLLITIPFSWGYMAVREHSGYEQSVVQTLVLLPMVVAAIMLVVQSSLALAFALGGVAAAVRFRNTLKDVADATYVFLAIGLGIAAGTGALAGALVMAVLFTYVSLLLWRCNFGMCASQHATLDTIDAPPRRIRGEMLVDIRDERIQPTIESQLSSLTRRWKLAGTSRDDEGGIQLRYRIQLKRSTSPQMVQTALDVLRADGLAAVRIQPESEAA